MEDVLELFTFWGDEEDSGAGSIMVKGSVKVRDPVLGSGIRWRVLYLGPLGNEVGERLRLDGGTWREFDRKCTELY